jgi:glycosyltransferase involved in cell wall biosynthesis
VDTATFSPARRHPAKRAALGPQQSTLLLYAGRMAREKNLGLLIEMMECLIRRGNDCVLLMAGAGELREQLKTRCEARVTGRVHFLDFIRDRAALADLYANVDIFVHPNPREPFGIGPLEAMASGIALVAPNTGGLTAYANNQNAWLRSADAEAFADAIEEIQLQPELAALKVAASIRTAATFGWDSIADRFLDLYEDLDAVTRGIKSEPSIKPRFYSTPGTYFGGEITLPQTSES